MVLQGLIERKRTNRRRHGHLGCGSFLVMDYAEVKKPPSSGFDEGARGIERSAGDRVLMSAIIKGKRQMGGEIKGVRTNGG